MFAVPGLCSAGWLDHFCTDHEEEAACSHEEDCLEDPCASPSLRPDRPDFEHGDMMTAPVFVFAMLAAPPAPATLHAAPLAAPSRADRLRAPLRL
jgi:hypothetical protein